MKNNTTLLTQVREALAKDETLTSCLDNIYFLVNDGAVIIAGSVTQNSVRTLIKKIVAAVPGVNLLIDDLRVEPFPPRVSVQIDWAKGNMALV